MSKVKKEYICTNCNATFPRWVGKCSECGSWNSIEERTISEKTTKNRTDLRQSQGYSNLSNRISKLSEIKHVKKQTTLSGMSSIDNLLSSEGGLVRGSITLIGGDPGIGKSTLLLQLSALFAKQSKVIYFSGEESEGQISLRAERLGINPDLDISIANIANLESILSILDSEKPDFIVIDSAQTIYSSELSSMAGSVSQLKECVSAIAQKCKSLNIDVFIIGHVTKDGEIAGPQTLAHIVDTVLYFEGEKESNFRILRVEKNRYGTTDETVILEMTENGLIEVNDPSAIFLENNFNNLDVGTVILSTVYNNRASKNNSAMLIEVQSLVNETGGQYASKVANGVEYNRLSIILGIIKKFSSFPLHKYDVFVSVVSGIKIIDSASDLAVFLSLLSSLRNQPIINNTAVFGEISLNGNLRLPKNYEKRINVAEKIGFKNIILPVIQDENILKKIKSNNKKIKLIMCKNVVEVSEKAFDI